MERSLQENIEKKSAMQTKKKLSERWKGKKMGGDNPCARKVVCLNTGEVFNSIAEAGRKYSITTSNISACCNGRKKSAGKINKEPARWMHYDKYLKTVE